MNEIREDMLKVKRMVSEVEMILGKREGETELVNKLIDAENLLTYCMSRLENAIVLPVKPGDTVYFDNTGHHDSAEIDGIHIDENDIAFSWVQYDVGVDITELWDEGEFDIEEIGKTVFLTPEEAEKALKERETK